MTLRLLFTAATWLIVNLAASAQKPTADFSHTTNPFEVSENRSVTRFNLIAKPDQLEYILLEAAKYNTLKLAFTPDPAGQYNCVLTVNDQPQAEYIHKLFLSFGIGGIITGSGHHDLDQLVPFLTK
jgi:hypothetical protein